LGRSASTISREVSRNGGLDRYRAARSDQAVFVPKTLSELMT
jgi:IS30 family transposase